MCKCTPEIRTPFCGKPGCTWPEIPPKPQMPPPLPKEVLMPNVEIFESPATEKEGALRIFLAGGIDRAPNWQEDAISLISKYGEIIVPNTKIHIYNPRRKTKFTTEDYNSHNAQVAWEFKHLRKADLILFWFPESAPCTTSLFELGFWVGNSPEKVILGVNPGHYKEKSLRNQFQLLSYKVYNSLEETVKAALYAGKLK